MLARWVLTIGIFVLALLPATAQADRRVALVVGNSNYKFAQALRNPSNDASDVAAILKNLNFDVLLATDLDQHNFATTIEKFARMLDDADVALFFYAGHGLQVNEKNYLVSINARLENEFLLSSETMELDSIVRLMESKSPVNLVFLDACRNNPLADNLRRSLTVMKRGVQLGRGLARMEVSGRDTLIAFAAAPGQEASDGSERNSPFTGALLRHLPKPGLEVSVMLKEVAADVRRDTRNGQRPQQLSDMTKTFYFAKLEQAAASAPPPKPAAPPAPPPATAAPFSLSGEDRAVDMAFWNSVSSANDCDAVRAYLERFPRGLFVELAKLSERRLCTPGRTAAIADPAPKPNVASVPQPAPAPTQNVAAVSPPASPAQPAAPPPIDPAMARDAQLELVRLGCAVGDVKDAWTPEAKNALRKYNRFARAKLDVERPSADMMAALRGHDTRVCPLECGPGTKAQGDVCVAVDRVVPAKSAKEIARERAREKAREKAERARERERERRTAIRSAEPPPRAAPTDARPPATKTKGAKPDPKSEFASPLCESRIQNAQGKWCCTYDPPRGPSVIICK